MPSKRDADAASLGRPRRSMRLRSQHTQPEVLHKSPTVTTTSVIADEFHDELGLDDPESVMTPTLPKPTFKGPGKKLNKSAANNKFADELKFDDAFDLGTPIPPKPTSALEPEASQDKCDPPEYVQTYQYFTDGLRSLTGWSELRKDDEGNEMPGKYKDHWILHNGDIIDQLCDPFFTFDIKMNKDETMKTLSLMGETAAKIIQHVAQGGPRGRDDWYELFRDNETRKHVVFAVLGLVMKDFVFSSLCYGGDHDQVRILHRDVDVKYCDYPYEGFIRTRIRGKKIEKLWAKNPGYMQNCFVRQSKELAWQTYEILAPVLALHPDVQKRPPLPHDTSHGLRKQHQQKLLRVLFTLVTRAGLLSLHMRLDRQTVYGLAPPHKDDYHVDRDMHVLNEDTMRKSNRFHNATWPGMPGSKRKQWRAAVLDAALVRIAAFPGVVAYKPGGWKGPCKESGYRVAEIAKRIVALRWGKESPWPGDGAWEEWMDVWRAERERPLPDETR